jgi:hypothetical protein
MGDSVSAKRSVVMDVLSIYVPSFFNTVGMSFAETE